MNSPRVADEKPCPVTLEAGVYSWCACGYAREGPLCDGAHIGRGFCPVTFILEKRQQVVLCQCKQTQNPPYCDGAHARLQAKD